MVPNFQITTKRLASFLGLTCLLTTSACLGTGSNVLQNSGLNNAPAETLPPIENGLSPTAPADTAVSTSSDIYADLPTGPRDTGTYPDLRNEPRVRIVDKPGEDVEALTSQMTALADAHKAGRISTAAYNRRLAYLRKLANNHSSDMLEQIGEPAN